MKRFSGWALGAGLLVSLGWSGVPQGYAAEPTEAVGFEVHRGVNVSHWLSQSEDRGAERAAKMTAADFATIKELGFDHVRLPVDEEQLWDEAGNRHDEAFDLLHDGIRWSLDNGLRVIVDLHVIRAHHFNRPDSRQLWDDPEARAKFIGLWKELSAELHDYPLDMVAYEPLNEAVAEDSEDWNELINEVISALRELEPERVIVMGSNRWQIAGTFPDLRIPADDPNIILSFHIYTPMPVTHYTAPWTPLAGYTGPIAYPGQAIDEAEYEGMDATLLAAVEEHNGKFDRAALEAIMLPAIEVARAANLPLYCGEFGAFPAAPLAVRQAWYRDMIAIFDEHDIAWAHWNYKDDFPLVTEDGEPITELMKILVPGEGSAASR
jgi:endoglucanase